MVHQAHLELRVHQEHQVLLEHRVHQVKEHQEHLVSLVHQVHLERLQFLLGYLMLTKLLSAQRQVQSPQLHQQLRQVVQI
jgi:hypothetical protein